MGSGCRARAFCFCRKRFCASWLFMRHISVFLRGRLLGLGEGGSDVSDRGVPSSLTAVTLVADDASPAPRISCLQGHVCKHLRQKLPDMWPDRLFHLS